MKYKIKFYGTPDKDSDIVNADYFGIVNNFIIFYNNGDIGIIVNNKYMPTNNGLPVALYMVSDVEKVSIIKE